MKTYNKTCKECNSPFIGTGPAAKFCGLCAEFKRKETERRGSYNHKLRNGLIKKPGVGKGGNQGLGSEHHSFKNGLGCNFQNQRKRIKEERRYCERCSKDLLKASRYEWCIHHKDHNRANNIDSNFELLCKKCHQLEHDCHLAFLKRATTSRKT